jgi:NAD(P)-dependent dehydrogenase (short-subunit alcohol dehydrogenase family)
MLLADKVAVIYGAGGAIGGAVARAFGREGAPDRGRRFPATGHDRAAEPFLTGRASFCMGNGQDRGPHGTEHPEDLRRITGFAV